MVSDKEVKLQHALHWIVDVLRKHDIPFQITGGFAAHIYGATRPIADIDLDIPEGALGKILPEIQEYAIYWPARYVDKEWDLALMTLDYKGQEIDICSPEEMRVFDKNTARWEALTIDFSTAETHELFGLNIPVASPQALLAYKSKIRREVDLIDIPVLERYVATHYRHTSKS